MADFGKDKRHVGRNAWGEVGMGNRGCHTSDQRSVRYGVRNLSSKQFPRNDPMKIMRFERGEGGRGNVAKLFNELLVRACSRV